jgi:DNA modification methylase
VRIETIGDATLYLGDCREVLPGLTGVDAVVTDPPYGIGEAAGKNKTRSNAAVARDYGDADWDDEPCPPELIQAMRDVSRWQIIFGGNYFAVPPSSCWLVWDKKNTGDFADCELAWTNLPKAVRRIEWMWNGMIRKGHDVREHPTQKPVGVMGWCLSHLPTDVRTVCDPFMGSGTTGVAAIERGFRFIGIEREPRYFDIACRRIEAAYKQADLFVAPPVVAAPVQETLI